MRRPERQRKEYRTWQQCENRCIAAGSRLSYTLQDGPKGNPGYKARTLVNETGYHRRDPDLAEIEQQLGAATSKSAGN